MKQINIKSKFIKELTTIMSEIDSNIFHAELPSSVTIPIRYLPNYLKENEDNLSRTYTRLKDKNSKKSFLCLIAATITNNHRFYYHAISDYKQYYHPKIKPEKYDTILDLGGFDGIGAIDFINYLKGKGTVISLEPNKSNYNILKANIKLSKYKNKIISANKGSWSNKGALYFTHDVTHPGARISQLKTDFQIDVISIDELVNELGVGNVSIIKMDVESAELESLKGSIETIKKYKPKLQISIYHKPEDLWEISDFIESLNLGYEQYIGHHYHGFWESVLYAKV
jgi:FkbM family methyltransferase